MKNVNLALQGGGALGAFVWGVLDRLLEGGRKRTHRSLTGREAATTLGAWPLVCTLSGMFDTE